MKKRKGMIAALILTLLLAAMSAGCGDAHSKDLMLYLKFDEGSGILVKDASGHLPDTEMTYGFAHAAYMENQDPQWRDEGVKDGCLLFDGSNTYINYNRKDVTVSGSALTISVWIAPRTFEWDDPYAADNGTDSPTGIISQSDKAANKGFLLGYERFGRLTFQVGTGDEWLTVWTNGDNLRKYEWNHVAATFDSEAGDMCLYLNGELAASRSVPQGAQIEGAAGKGLAVGRNMEAERLTAGFLNVASGYMDELKVYSQAFTAEEIAGEYQAVKVPEIEFSRIWLQNLLTGDYTRPQFHGGPYQFRMNEPHAPVYYNGMYHLFYQANMTGSYFCIWRGALAFYFFRSDSGMLRVYCKSLQI